ncbi:MAG: ASKHA domain-containing protein [Candidatus Marinimicrobia bacterium]|nr:ASKHA domain-containing protein [Candidatus Neomarinimicrobiota bacterium]
MRLLPIPKGFHSGRECASDPGDIRAFQMAKSAITASWKLLFSLSNFHPEDLDCLVLAGAFGHYIRPETGMELGLFPRVANKKFIYLGNGSLSGCEMVLKNKAYAERIQAIASEAEHVEMAGREDFQEMYALNMGLGRDVYEK